MTVKELMKELEQFPNNMEVVVSGYEGGYDSVAKTRISIIEVDYNSNVSLSTNEKFAWYYGEHGDSDLNLTKVVALCRNDPW